MEVKLISYTPIDVAYFSAKTCYSKISPIELYETDKVPQEDKIKFLKKIIATGHLSTIEGINFTLLINSVSRSLLTQLTRHRIGVQFSVQSQRYVKYTKDNYSIFTPLSILSQESALKEYNRIQEECFTVYQNLLGIGIPKEDARYVLPNATCTNVTMTINLRALMHLMELRLCSRASQEIRYLMEQIKLKIVEKEPWLKDYLVPKCEVHGFCTEHQCCGRKPRLEDIVKG